MRIPSRDVLVRHAGTGDEEGNDTRPASWTAVVLVDRRAEAALAREELDGRLDLAEVQSQEAATLSVLQPSSPVPFSV